MSKVHFRSIYCFAIESFSDTSMSFYGKCFDLMHEFSHIVATTFTCHNDKLPLFLFLQFNYLQTQKNQYLLINQKYLWKVILFALCCIFTYFDKHRKNWNDFELHLYFFASRKVKKNENAKSDWHMLATRKKIFFHFDFEKIKRHSSPTVCYFEVIYWGKNIFTMIDAISQIFNPKLI